MKILVTGGAGYIGSQLVPSLLQRGHHVTVLDNFRYGQTPFLSISDPSRLKIVRGDVRDPIPLERLTRDQDAVLPLAALVGAPLCDRDVPAAISTNSDAIQLLCSIVRPETKIIYPTTNSGYGIGRPGELCTEETPLNPLTLYGKTKVAAESAVMIRQNSISLRLATVFGFSPRMRLDLLVNDFVYRAVKDRALVVFEGHFKRNYIHIRDVVRAFEFMLDHFSDLQGQVFNVGLSTANLSKLELCAEIQKELPEFIYLEAPIGKDPDQRNYIVSNEKIERAGFTAFYSLQDGIRELIQGYSTLTNERYGNLF